MITVRGVHKYYGAHAAVRDLDFTIAKGECVGLLGLNGAGKSTTLKLLGGLLNPTTGHIEVEGQDTHDDAAAVRALVGYLPETPPLYREMSVRGQLAFAGGLRGLRGDILAGRIEAVAQSCDLTRVLDVELGSLSHGFQQRAGIAQAILHEPALLILDEPTQGLDPVQIAEVRALIRALRGRHTILLSTHILSEIEAVCDRILVLHEGRVAAQGTEAELVARFGMAGGGFELEVQCDSATAERDVDAALAPLVAEHGATVEATLQVLGDGAATRTTGERPRSVVRVRVQAERDLRSDASRLIVAAGLDLVALRRVRSGLEDMFSNLGAPPGSDSGATHAGDTGGRA